MADPTSGAPGDPGLRSGGHYSGGPHRLGRRGRKGGGPRRRGAGRPGHRDRRDPLARHASEVQTRLDYYVARMRLESDEVADAFERLVTVTRQEAGAQMTEAWEQPRITSDAEMPVGTRYARDRADAEKVACLKVMLAHLIA
jgi:hypothetical protein